MLLLSVLDTQTETGFHFDNNSHEVLALLALNDKHGKAIEPITAFGLKFGWKVSNSKDLCEVTRRIFCIN